MRSKKESDAIRRKLIAAPYIFMGLFAFIAVGRWEFVAVAFVGAAIYVAVANMPRDINLKICVLLAVSVALGAVGFLINAWLGQGFVFILFVVITLVIIFYLILRMTRHLESAA